MAKFDEHVNIFREQTDGIFSIEYGEDEFAGSYNVGLSLIAAELVINVAGFYHTLNGWSGPERPFNLSDIRIFVPA